MPRSLLIWMSLAIFLSAPVAADEVVKADLGYRLDNTSVVWIKGNLGANQAEVETIFGKGASYLPAIGAVIVNGSQSEVQAKLPLLRKDVSPASIAKIDIESVERNSLAYAFAAGCDNLQALPTSEQVPPNITRVITPNGFAQFPATRKVWIVDGGIAPDYDGTELNVNRTLSAKCGITTGTTPTCTADPANVDLTGHATALAGIIGAKQSNGGLVGVAPNVIIVPVQIFNDSDSVTDSATILAALNYVALNATTDDVVNLSFGIEWDPTDDDQPKIEKLLRDLAGGTKKLRFSIAAGNRRAITASYVQQIVPARIGGFRSGTGVIVAVSAANNNDVWWNGSAYGNFPDSSSAGTSALPGPPNYAEPGRNVRTLWPGNKTARCTGTSFSAAHMSGILAEGLPANGGPVSGDPSAVDPSTGVVDPTKLEPVGIVPP